MVVFPVWVSRASDGGGSSLFEVIENSKLSYKISLNPVT